MTRKNHPGNGGRHRLRSIIPLITAAALSISLAAVAAGPASASVREPARATPASLGSAARYVRLNGGRFFIDIRDAEKAGVSSQTLSAENSLVASMNKSLDHGTAADTSRSVVINAAKTAADSIQDTTITVLPGIQLSITSTGVQLAMTAEAVDETQTLAGSAEKVASIVGDILVLALVAVPYGPDIASAITGLIADAIGIGSEFLMSCTASDGSATFTVPWPWLWLSLDLPSCSGTGL